MTAIFKALSLLTCGAVAKFQASGVDKAMFYRLLAHGIMDMGNCM